MQYHLITAGLCADTIRIHPAGASIRPGIGGRVVSLTALSTAAFSCGNCMSQDRRYFGAMDALIRNQESPCSTPESAARFVVEQGIVPGEAEPEWKSQRIARNYRKDRKLKKSR